MILEFGTIAAICTALSPGAVGIIRISGEKAQEVADKIFIPAKKGVKLEDSAPNTFYYGKIVDEDGEKIDEAIALNFIAPKSYTGENVVELSCHGGIYVLQKVLNLVVKAGARLAAPGEFSKRAFLNGKFDLSQAEAVMDIISAKNEQAAKIALAAKDGALSKGIEKITEELVNIAAHLSAWADYPDDDVPQIDENMLTLSLNNANEEITRLINSFDRGKILKDGVETAIIGRPNAGKSTLMNLLAGSQKSIVTHIAGTTRDVVEERVVLSNIVLNLADTAGMRSTDDPVEKIGVQIAKDKMKTAQLVFAVFDCSEELSEDDFSMIENLKSTAAIAIINKNDLESKIDSDFIEKNFDSIVYISAKDGTGLLELEAAVENIFHTKNLDDTAAMLNTQRQKDTALRAHDSVIQAKNAYEMGMTLDAVTVCVEDAIKALLELSGKSVSEEVVNSVFEKFCVGK